MQENCVAQAGLGGIPIKEFYAVGDVRAVITKRKDFILVLLDVSYE